MEYYKELHDPFEDNLEVLHSYSGFLKAVDNNDKECLKPHCNCEEVHIFYGLKITSNVRNGAGLDKPTLLNESGECAFCEHNVLWKKQVWDGRSKRGRRSIV